MTFQEIQEKLKKCELALTSIKDGSYSNTKYTKEEALEKFNTIKESLEKKLNLLKEDNVVITRGSNPKDVQQTLRQQGKTVSTQDATDMVKQATKTGEPITVAEDDLSDEEQEEITTETSHTEVVAKEVHKAFIDALQETGHEVSEHSISSLNPETFTLTVKFKDNTQSDYSFEFEGNEVKLDGNILVTTNKKGVTPILNKTIAKDNSVKYLQNLSEKKGKDHDGDGDIDSDDYMIAKDKAIKANMKEDESEPVVDKKGKYTGVRRLILSPKQKKTLIDIEKLLAKEKKSKTTKEESLKEVNYSAHTKPKHFDICPGAESLRDELLDGGKTPEELGKWTYIHDELFKLEKDVLKSKKATDSDVKKAEQFASDLVNISRDLGIDAGKVNYLKGHVKKIKDVAKGIVKEEEGENHERIVVPRSQLEDALEIIKDNIDGNHVKVTSGSNISGNGIIKFHFNPSYSNVQSYMYDTVMNLVAQDINVKNSTKYIDEALDQNDPVLMRSRVAKMRADDMKKLDALKKQADKDRKKAMRRWNQKKYDKWLEDVASNGGAENAFDMAKNAEFEPGLIDWIKKEFPYDDALQRIQWDIEALAETEDDYGRTGLEPRTFVDPEDLTPAAMAKEKLNKEHISVGHPDNEPGMLKQDAYDIAHYAVKLYKLLKYYDSLEDQVDFPHWWQSKVVKAREYISKAAHYLEFKTNEPAIDSHVDALQEGRSANAIKKEYDALVKKMIELAKEYKQAEGDKKQKLVDQLKDHTKKKKALEKELDQAVQKTGAGQELDTSINELSGDQRNDLIELQNILDDVAQKGEEAREIIRQSFPKMLSKADAYGAFDFGSSSNRYDTTLASIIEEIEQYYDEEEDLDEIGMFHDPIRYSSTAAAEDKRALQLVKDLINKGVNKEDAIEKAAEKFKLRVDYLTRYVNKSIDEGKYKSDAQRKAIYAAKAEKGELKEFTDKSFKGSELIDKANSNAPDMFGKQIFADLLPKGVASENDAFEALRAHDKSGLKQRMGPQFAPMFVHVQYHELEHEGESYRLHQRQFYNSNFQDKDPNFNPKVTEITLIKIVEKGDRQRGTDKTENLGTILVKTDVYTQDLHQLRRSGKLGQQHMEEVIKEGATCCGRCGRVHVKGSGCKRPYLKGKSHCRNK